MDQFTMAYIECALWSSNDESGESGGTPFDENYTSDDIHPNTLAAMVADCKRFQAENADDIATYPGGGEWIPGEGEMAGHDFWLSRNGHGAGFFDSDWPKDAGERLQVASEAFGECNLYVSNGRIYG